MKIVFPSLNCSYILKKKTIIPDICNMNKQLESYIYLQVGRYEKTSMNGKTLLVHKYPPS